MSQAAGVRFVWDREFLLSLSARVCRFLPHACSEGDRCGQYALFVPPDSSLPHDLCAFHLDKKGPEDALSSWARELIEYLKKERCLDRVNLAYARFEGTEKAPLVFPPGVQFIDVYLEEAEFRHVRLVESQFRNLKSGGSLPGLIFADCNLRGSVFSAEEIRGVTFERCDLSFSSWFGRAGDTKTLGSRCRLVDVDLAGSQLSNVLLLDCQMTNVGFAQAKLQRLSVEGGRWEGVDLSEAEVHPKQLWIGEGLVIDGSRFPETFREPLTKLVRVGKVKEEGRGIIYVTKGHRASISTRQAKILELVEQHKAELAGRVFTRPESIWTQVFNAAIASVVFTLIVLGLTGFPRASWLAPVTLVLAFLAFVFSREPIGQK